MLWRLLRWYAQPPRKRTEATTRRSETTKQRRTMKPTQFRRFRFCPRSVTPYARSRNFQLAHDGSSLVTNAARKTPPQSHQLNHTIHRAKLRSVDFTAAAKDRSSLRSVDATADPKNKQFKPAVCATSAG